MRQSSGKIRPQDAIRVTVSPDRMVATVMVDRVLAPEGVDPALVLDALVVAGVVVEDEKPIWGLAGANGCVTTASPVVVARGTSALPGTPDHLHLSRQPAALPLSGSFPMVADGEVLGRIEPGNAGREGREVTGRRFSSGTPRPEFELCAGVVRDPDGTIRATRAGRLSQGIQGGLSVLDLTEIPGDLISSTPLPEETGDLRVDGNIRDWMGLALRGSLAVRGAVEAHRVEAGEDILAAGGLIGTVLENGTDRGLYQARRDIRCKFILSARVESGRDIWTTEGIISSKVQCAGKLNVGERIHGSMILASAGIACRAVASSSSNPACLEVGFDPVLRDMAESALDGIEGSIEQVNHGKKSIGPLLSRRGKLTPAQKAHTAELIRATNRLEREIKERTDGLRARWELARKLATACIEVEDLISAGVTIRFPGLEFVTTSALRGPLRIIPLRQPGDEPKLQLTDRKTGQTSLLPAKYVSDPVTSRVTRVLSKIA